MTHPTAPHDGTHGPAIPLWAILVGILVLQTLVVAIGWKLLF